MYYIGCSKTRVRARRDEIIYIETRKTFLAQNLKQRVVWELEDPEVDATSSFLKYNVWSTFVVLDISYIFLLFIIQG
jgi:hypothetical protein